MKTFARFAAMILLAMGAVVGLVYVRVGQSVAFADVARRLHDARTLTADMSTTLPDGKTIHSKLFYASDGRYRLESGESTTITDLSRGVTLTLDAARKRATLLDVRPKGDTRPASDTRPAGDPSEFLEQLLHVQASGGKPIGEKTVDGRSMKGFEIAREGQRAVIWADARTGEPLRLEMSTRAAPAGQAVSVVMDHLVINPKLDDALFSTEVPQGYSQQQATLSIPAGQPAESDVVEFLREYAHEFGGAFPPGLEPEQWAAPLKARAETGTNKLKPRAKPGIELFALSGRATVFLSKLPHGYRYAGSGALLGQADKVIFWYRRGDSNEYRAIYGDLRAATVPAASLPTSDER